MSASRSTSSPRIRPSASAAIVIFCHWSRPWCTVMLPSLRLSVHLTGRPSLRAIRRASTSSAVTCSFDPKPPPTSGAMTRRFCSGMPVTRASITRSTCGIWVADHRVNSPPTHEQTTERGSIAAGISRCWRKYRSSTTGASRKAASMSPLANGHSKLLLPASWTLGESSRRAVLMSSTGGSGS